MAYGDFIYLPRRTSSVKVFMINNLALLKIRKMMSIKEH